MASLRKITENFVYRFFDKFATLAYEGKEDAEFYGIKVMQERENFVRGTIVNSTAQLYIHYVKTADVKAEATLDKLKYFIEGATSRTCKTWGKFSILRALASLHNAKLLNKIDKELLEKCKASTDYTDFFDKETRKVIALPSNYLQVALACAALREKIGFDNDGYYKIITDELIEVVKQSQGGWMDEAPPYRRFDRYSFLVSSELSDTCLLADIDFPNIFKDNLKLAAKHCLFMANKNGDGWNYGRSLSCHGDGAIAEVLASALSRGLLDENEKPLALAYIGAITEKILSFWYDKERDSFNIWWDGRSTNGYRQVHRVMQVGLDMGLHLLSTLSNLTIAKLDNIDYDTDLIKSPDKWEYDIIDFCREENQISAAVLLRYKDTLSMLPISGLAHHYVNSAYMPYPAICRRVESAPEGPMPFLIPEYSCGEDIYRPCQFFDHIDVKYNGGAVEVNASGRLAKRGEKMPTDSLIPFSVCYKFEKNTIDVTFNCSTHMDSAAMFVGTHSSDTKIEAYGFDTSRVVFENPDITKYACFNINTANEDDKKVYKYMTPHGFITHAVLYSTVTTNKLSYKITL